MKYRSLYFVKLQIQAHYLLNKLRSQSKIQSYKELLYWRRHELETKMSSSWWSIIEELGIYLRENHIDLGIKKVRASDIYFLEA